MKAQSTDKRFSFPKQGLMLWKKILTWFVYTTIGFLIFIVVLGISGFLVGDRIGKVFLAVICTEATAGIGAIIAAVMLSDKIFPAYQGTYGENAQDNYNRCWKYYTGNGGFWGIVIAIIFFFLNMRAWETYFRS